MSVFPEVFRYKKLALSLPIKLFDIDQKNVLQLAKYIPVKKPKATIYVHPLSPASFIVECLQLQDTTDFESYMIDLKKDQV